MPAALDELSGLAASRRHPGVFWAHQDSGHAAELVALASTGQVIARFPLAGVHVRDPEDVATGPCGPADPAPCVWLADTGDNLRRHPDAALLRVAEPDRLVGRPLAAAVLRFRYPDGGHDVEALLVDPRDGHAYVVTKALLSLGDAYRLDDLGPRTVGRAMRLGPIASPERFAALVTAGDAHPGGERLLLLTYGGAFELRRPGARSLADVLGATPRPVPMGEVPQAEAIAYTGEGTGYVVAGEGAATPVVRVDCAPPGR